MLSCSCILGSQADGRCDKVHNLLADVLDEAREEVGGAAAHVLRRVAQTSLIQKCNLETRKLASVGARFGNAAAGCASWQP